MPTTVTENNQIDHNVADAPNYEVCDTASSLNAGKDDEAELVEAAAEAADEGEVGGGDSTDQSANNNKRAVNNAERAKKVDDTIQYLTTVPLDGVVIETDSQGKSRITHIGTEDFAKLGIKARDAYMKHHRIIIGDARTKDQKEVRIIQHIQAGPLKAALSTNRRSVATTSGAKVKPTWLLQTGTILRLINFITSEAGRGHYISLKGGLTATMLDTAIPHPQAYATILDLFNTPENQDDNIELVQQYDELPQIFDEMESSKYDELTREKLIELITYVDYWYGNASKAMKNVSGTHDANFRKYCKGISSQNEGDGSLND